MEPHSSIKGNKISGTAKIVITILIVLVIIQVLDLITGLMFRNSALMDHKGIRDSVSSVSAEERLTARRLDDFVEMSKKRWTFLREDNQGKISVPAMTAEEVDLQKSYNQRQSPAPTPTLTPASTHSHQHRARPHPTPQVRLRWPWEIK